MDCQDIKNYNREMIWGSSWKAGRTWPAAEEVEGNGNTGKILS